MSRKLFLAAAMLLLSAGAVMAKGPQMMQVTGGTVLVNGKPFTGGALPKNAKVEVAPGASVKIGGLTITSREGATLKISGSGKVKVTSGTTAVTTASGQTLAVAAGESVNSSGEGSASTPPSDSSGDTTMPPPPPPNPSQDTTVVSPSTPERSIIRKETP